MSLAPNLMSLVLRSPLPGDVEPCGKILSDAFTNLHRRHGFPADFPTHEVGVQFISGPMRNPSFYGVVAELNGKIVGSNFLDERDPIRAVGPISVDPSAQGHGVGKKLMEAVIERGSGAPGIRLVQEAFNTSSLPLYAALGFDPVEPLFLLSGKPRNKVPASYEIRPLVAADLEESPRSASRSVIASAAASSRTPSLDYLPTLRCGRDGSPPTAPRYGALGGCAWCRRK